MPQEGRHSIAKYPATTPIGICVDGLRSVEHHP